MSSLGAHVTSTGSRNGYGGFVSAKPRVVLSVNDGGALLEAKQKSGGHTYTVFRDTSIYLEAPPDINSPPGTYEEMASYWYFDHNNGGLRKKWRQNPADAYTITNEQGSSHLPSMRNLVSYEREIMKLANADGFRVAVLSLAGGNPASLDLWAEVYAPFIIEAWAAGNIYARHAYGGGDLVDANGIVIPGNPSRPFEEAQWMADHGHRGGIVIKECGLDGGFGFAGTERFTSQMEQYEQEVRALDPGGYFIGICMWLLGNWQAKNSNWEAAIPSFIPYMNANPTPAWTLEPGDPPPDQDPPDPDPPGEEVLVGLLFTGRGVADVGENNASWYDEKAVQVPISPAGGQRWRFSEWSGKNPCSDLKSWNDYVSPEGKHMGQDLPGAGLPPHEHHYYNSAGRTYKLFAGSGTWRVRYEYDVHIPEDGDIELYFELWGDWADFKDGQKVPKPDPDHAHIEIFVDDRGRENWVAPKFIESNIFTLTASDLPAGLHTVGFGLETCFAPAKGVNGCFIQEFSAMFIPEETEPPPDPVDIVDGMDVSHHNFVDGAFDAVQAWSVGNRYLFAKASDGFTIVPGVEEPRLDPNYHETIQLAIDGGFKVGSYHFYQPEESPQEQADLFIGIVKETIAQHLPPVLDLEKKPPAGMSLSVYQSDVHDWLVEVESRLGKTPIIYSGLNFYNTYLNVEMFDRFLFWYSNPTGGTELPTLPDRREEVEIWQWSWTQDGPANGVESPHVDADRWYGTLEKFYAVYGANWLVKDPVPPADCIELPVGVRRHILRPREMSKEQWSWIEDVTTNGLDVDDTGTKEPVGYEGWSHIDAMAAILEAVEAGFADSRFIVYDGHEIGTGFDEEWMENNCPTLAPYTRFFFTDTIEEFRYQVWPTEFETVTQLFGVEPEIYAPFGLPGHDGVDIRARLRTKIFAAAAGVISNIHLNPNSHNYGIHVRVVHADLVEQTIYAHLDKVTPGLIVGRKVEAGDLLGLADNTGNSFGSHLHFGRKRLGETYVDENGDTWPYNLHDPTPLIKHLAPDEFPDEPEPIPPPQPGNAGFGLHASADPGDLGSVEFDMFRDCRPDVIKVLSAHSGPSIARLAAEHPGASFIVRAFLDFGGRDISPNQFFNDTINDVTRAVESIGAGRDIHIELHNEPNLTTEGYLTTWFNGEDFSVWLLEVLDLYKAELFHLPQVEFMYPGLSPGSAIPGFRRYYQMFLTESTAALAACDSVGIHAYWNTQPGTPFPLPTALDTVDSYILNIPGQKFWVTESSNNKLDTPENKAAQYIEFWRGLRLRPSVQGVTYYVASATNPKWGWGSGGSGEIWEGTEIATLVGQRR